MILTFTSRRMSRMLRVARQSLVDSKDNSDVLLSQSAWPTKFTVRPFVSAECIFSGRYGIAISSRASIPPPQTERSIFHPFARVHGSPNNSTFQRNLGNLLAAQPGREEHVTFLRVKISRIGGITIFRSKLRF